MFLNILLAIILVALAGLGIEFAIYTVGSLLHGDEWSWKGFMVHLNEDSRRMK